MNGSMLDYVLPRRAMRGSTHKSVFFLLFLLFRFWFRLDLFSQLNKYTPSKRSPLKRKTDERKKKKSLSARDSHIHMRGARSYTHRSHCTENLDTIYSVELFKICSLALFAFNIVGAFAARGVYNNNLRVSVQTTFTLALVNRKREIKSK